MRNTNLILAAGLCIGHVAAILAVRVVASRSRASDALERERLRAGAVELERRTSQLSALYQVFSEITDNLSLEHVISGTLTEAVKLMRCDMAVLRVLRGEQLVVLGAM